MQEGREYVIDSGSFAGQKRKEFDLAVIKIKHPASRPLVPDTPAGIPPPVTMDFIEEYLPYLMTAKKAEKEMYTYGQDIEFQLQPIIDMYKEEGYNTNHGCITVGSKYSIHLEHSQCLRVIDTRIIDKTGLFSSFCYSV